MDLNSSLPFYILICPLLGFFINGVVLPIIKGGFAKTPANLAGGVATAAVFTSFILGLSAWWQLHESGQPLLQNLFTWWQFGDFTIPFELRIDQLSMTLVLIITGIGTLIHLYSIGYMHEDECVGRFFSYLNLFCFAMLLLVMGNNLVMLFFGWEGVGLCSFLLIGFWYTDAVKAQHGKKAFVVNRIGDLGFLLGMFLLYKHFNTLTLTTLVQKLSLQETAAALGGPWGIASMIALCLFVGATGKSAQIPLFVWLPDAMSGPTPVSALIHAATMVTAGVYMIVRLNPLFSMAPDAMNIVATVGAITALFAGSIAIAQTDIKKVLAYSTVSQLGFMFLSCGVGAYQTAVFHLITHAFFKALLFLGSGSVIHACSGEQDMRMMGGLKKHLPHTYRTMMVGSLALSGVPFFSGFFSKDEILFSTLALPQGGSFLYIVGTLTAILTAIYTGRMMSMTFFGKERATHEVMHHLHESPPTMLVPLYVLAFLAAFGGLLGVPHLLGGFLGHMPHVLSHWLAPVAPALELPLVGIHLPLHEGMVILLSSLFAIGGFTLGLNLFQEKFFIRDFIPVLSGPNHLLQNKYFIDEIYDFIFVQNIRRLSRLCAFIIDRYVIDGLVGGMGRGALLIQQGLRVIQNGDLNQYLINMMVGMLLLVVLLVRKIFF